MRVTHTIVDEVKTDNSHGIDRHMQRMYETRIPKHVTTWKLTGGENLRNREEVGRKT